MEMSHKIKFVHMADLHLGAPLLGFSYNSSWQTKIKDAQNSAFKKAVDFAINNNVDFVIIAGDVFDRNAVNYDVYNFFAELVNKLDQAGINLYVCSGNHDPISSWKKIQNFVDLPNNFYLFSSVKPQSFSYYKDGELACNIVGKSFNDKKDSINTPLNDIFRPVSNMNQGCSYSGLNNCAKSRLRSKNTENVEKNTEKYSISQNPIFNIAVCHIDLPSYCYIFGNFSSNIINNSNADILEKLGYDYWALGHIHKRFEFRLSNTVLSYPGCIQGLHINAKGSDNPDTHGEYGFNYVEIGRDDNEYLTENKCRTRITFVPTTYVLWKKLSVDVGHCANLDDVVKVCVDKLNSCFGKSSAKYLCARITLRGNSPLFSSLHNIYNLSAIAEKINTLSSDIYCQDVVNNTMPFVDYKAIKEQNMFPAKLLFCAEDYSKNKQAVVDYIKNTAYDAKFALDINKIDDMDIDELIDKSLARAMAKIGIE